MSQNQTQFKSEFLSLYNLTVQAFQKVEEALFQRHFPYADEAIKLIEHSEVTVLNLKQEFKVISEPYLEGVEELQKYFLVNRKLKQLAQLSFNINEEPQLKAYEDLPVFSNLILENFKLKSEAFINQVDVNTILCEENDKKIQELNKKLCRDIQVLMKKTPNNVNRGVNLILATTLFLEISES